VPVDLIDKLRSAQFCHDYPPNFWVSLEINNCQLCSKKSLSLPLLFC
jgi:hypothetical protein